MRGDIAIMPITTTRQRFSRDSLTGPDDMQMLFIGFEDGVSLPKAKREIIKLLRERYRVRGKDINPFTIRTTKEFMEESAQVRGIFQIVLVAIASISLLVEAAVLCVIGGAMGLILAIAADTALTVYADFPVPIGVGVGIGAIMFSAIIGLLFGDYPAIRASYLSPIEALRSE
tara:strand:+ start:3865 stop:4383 length:519 start_codon:yes stop_codon:yes gene_type:complete